MNNLQKDTELQKIQRELKRSKEKCRQLYDFAPVGYFTFDCKGTILEVSLTGALQLDIEKSKLLQKSFNDYLLGESHVIFFEHLEKVLQESKHHTCELKIKHSEEEDDFFYAKMESVSMTDEEGEITQCRSAIMDITAQKKTEQQLKAANHTKSEFLAIMSHELRTPLNAVLGLSELLQQGIYGDLEKKQIQPIRMIYDSGQHLLSLINDMLELSKMDLDKIHIDFMSISVIKVGESSLRFLKESAKQKNIIISFSFEDSIPNIMADRRRLKQMLVNLLDNGIKFTPDGGKIGLDIIVRKEEIDFIVWDTGIGIAESDMQRLFQPFTQLDSGLNRKYGGTGLGLYLVYRLAKLHGGHISVISELNKGSRFTLSLPWNLQEEIR